MGRKHSNKVKLLIDVWLLFMIKFTGSLAETCTKIDDCSCQKSNGKVINLKQIDGGTKGAAFPNIKDTDSTAPWTYDWNPCTKITEGSDCSSMLMCQKSAIDTTETHPCAQTVSTFTVNSDGSTTIVYQSYTDDTSYKRTVEITLKCDKSQYPGSTGQGVKEDYAPLDSHYSMTFTSRCACDDGCVSNNPTTGSSTELSTGSILLIVFFVLLFVYLVAGIAIQKYKLGVESMPEMIPNFTFWAGIPSLVKDGIVFTFNGVNSGCSYLYEKCSKNSYAKI